MKLQTALSAIIALAIQSTNNVVNAQPEIELANLAEQFASGQYDHLLPSSSSLRGSDKTADATQGSDRDLQSSTCTESVDLDQFPQWQEEVGYWLGEYTFLGADGQPNVSAGWNYPYDQYKGFITGNISGGAYRQRNIFLYPPQKSEVCSTNPTVVGDGVCGVNGNTKRFEADQSTAGVPGGFSCDGTIEGLFAGFFDTKTTLVGKDNAVLYQVNFPQGLGGGLFQNQVTTLSGNGRRTRSAHGFPFPDGVTPVEQLSVPTYCSFYRERRVEKEEFYGTLGATLNEYNILEEDTCTRDSFGNLVGVGAGPGNNNFVVACKAHLEESFEL